MSLKVKSFILSSLIGLNIFNIIPFVSSNIGTKLENYVIVVFLPLLIIFNFYNNRKVFLTRILTFSIVLLILIWCNFNGLLNIKPLVYFTYLTLLIISKGNGLLNRKLLIQVCRLYTLINLSLVPFATFYFFGNRFFGMMMSPTIFATISSAVLIISTNYDKNRRWVFMQIVSLSFLIVLSHTRINIALLPIILIFNFYPKIYLKKMKLTFIVFVATVVLLYPIYDVISQSKYSQEFNRYEGNEDKSFSLRSALSIFILNEFTQDFSVKYMLFGRGSDASRRKIINEWGTDLQVHNDFLRFSYDFGLIALFVYLMFIFKISHLSPVKFLLGMIYLISFYHNMIYSFLIISFILLLPDKTTEKALTRNNCESI